MITVFVNGTFDILHTGHIQLLNYAKEQGDHLIVGIDSDRRIKELKGDSRPINKQYDRWVMLKNLKAVDDVIVFDSDSELVNLVESCDIMVKGDDYRGKPIVGEEVCKKLIFFERVNGYSTTNTIQNIINR
jgi:D-beta-D-heptose 7-phosphate kinase/D-beta-D-heptose 1-phosphate adenosyltransferase